MPAIPTSSTCTAAFNAFASDSHSGAACILHMQHVCVCLSQFHKASAPHAIAVCMCLHRSCALVCMRATCLRTTAYSIAAMELSLKLFPPSVDLDPAHCPGMCAARIKAAPLEVLGAFSPTSSTCTAALNTFNATKRCPACVQHTCMCAYCCAMRTASTPPQLLHGQHH